MTRKRIIALVSIVALAGLAIAIPWTIVAGGGDENGHRYKLEGTWVGKSLTYGTVVTVTIVPSSPANKKESFAADIVNLDPTLGGMFPDASPLQSMAIRGDAVRTGLRTFQVTWILYATDEHREIVWILIGEGGSELIDPNTYEDTFTMSLFSAREQVSPVLGLLPDQDADGDGLPDEGVEPLFTMPNLLIVKRLVPVVP